MKTFLFWFIALFGSLSVAGQYDSSGKYDMNHNFCKLNPQICKVSNMKMDSAKTAQQINDSLKTTAGIKRVGDSIVIIQKNMQGVEIPNSSSFRFSIADKLDASRFNIDSAAKSAAIASKQPIGSYATNAKVLADSNALAALANSKQAAGNYTAASKHSTDSATLRNFAPYTGSVTFSWAAGVTSYVVTHGLGFTPSKVFVQARSLNASALNNTNNYTATTFTITFLAVPTIGTNNITFDWQAYK